MSVRVIAGFLVGTLFFATACENVTLEKIETWKGTMKGPIKIDEAFKNPEVAPPVRAAALAALYELGKGESAEAELVKWPPAARAPVVSAAIAVFSKEMADPKRQKDARDGLFFVRSLAAPAEQPAIDAALLPSVESELKTGKSSGGRNSAEKIISVMGPAAGPVLLRALAASGASYVNLAEALGRVADPATREQAGKVLLQKFGPNPSQPAMWTSLVQVGGKSVSDFLKAKVEARGAEAPTAAQALQGMLPKDPTLVPLALRVAGDRTAPSGLRDAMFGLAEHLGGPEAKAGLIALIANDPEELVRYRAFEAVLVATKGDSAQAGLEAFSPKLSFKREDVLDYLAKDVAKHGAAGRAAALRAFSSPSALARMVAVMALETVGTAADAAAVERLAGDGSTIKGFPPGATVGKEAMRVASVLKSKK